MQTNFLDSINSFISTASDNPELLERKASNLEALRVSIQDLDTQRMALTSVSNTSPIRKRITYLINSLMSLSTAVEEDDIDPDEFVEEILGDVSDHVTAIETLIENRANSLKQKNDDGIVSESAEEFELGGKFPELDALMESMRKKHLADLTKQAEIESNRFTGVVEKLSAYSKFGQRLLSKLPSSGSVVPVELPVLVSFSDIMMNNPDNLKKIFPKVTALGVEHKSDVGIILEGQIVLQFSKSDALQRSGDKKPEKNMQTYLFNRVADFLNQLRAKGKTYTTLSNTMIVSPKNSDIMLCWIISDVQYRKLFALANGNTKIKDWGLPWVRRESQASKARLTSTQTMIADKNKEVEDRRLAAAKLLRKETQTMLKRKRK